MDKKLGDVSTVRFLMDTQKELPLKRSDHFDPESKDIQLNLVSAVDGVQCRFLEWKKLTILN